MTERDDESNVGYECGRGKDHLRIFAWLLVLKSEKGEMAKSHAYCLLRFFLGPRVYMHTSHVPLISSRFAVCAFL